MDRLHTGWAGVRTRWCLWTTVYAARQSPECCSSTANGIEGLARFGYEGGACRLSPEQQERLKTWIAKTLPRTTREVGAWIAQECGAGYESRSGLVALLHRRGMEHRTPKAISRKRDPEKQAAFIEKYEDLLNQLSADEAAIFGDAVHPTHAVRPGCRIGRHFVPAYCPHSNPIARLWGLMHRNVTHNECYATFRDFSAAMLTFPRRDMPENWSTFCDEVTDNFRVINPTRYRIIV